MRVMKGKKLPGRMGGEQVTIQNLEVVSVDTENNCILVSGNVPGAKGTFVFIRSAIKGSEKRTPVELVSYENAVEEMVEEITDETVQNVTEEVADSAVEEVVETTEEVTETEEAPEETTEEEVSE